MPSEREPDWDRFVKKLLDQTKTGELSWGDNEFPSSIRDDCVGSTIYSTSVKDRKLIVYEHEYRLYSDESEYTTERDIAVELVDDNGNLLWRLPKTPRRWALMDSIRYKLSGANDLYNEFLES